MVQEVLENPEVYCKDLFKLAYLSVKCFIWAIHRCPSAPICMFNTNYKRLLTILFCCLVHINHWIHFLIGCCYPLAMVTLEPRVGFKKPESLLWSSTHMFYISAGRHRNSCYKYKQYDYIRQPMFTPKGWTKSSWCKSGLSYLNLWK